MSTYSKSVQLSVVDSNGNVTELNPTTYTENVSINEDLRSNLPNVPSNVYNVHDLMASLGSTAFINKDKLAFINTSEEVGDCSVPESEINDEQVSLSSTYSSSKLSKSFMGYKADLDYLNAPYDRSVTDKIYNYPMTFVIRDKSLASKLSTACGVSNTDTYLIVEYFPYYCNTNKSVIDYDNVYSAFQRWTSPSGYSAIRYFRDNTWSELVKIG